MLCISVCRDDGIGWIGVVSPDDPTCQEHDVVGLQSSWEELQASGRPINLQTITELAHMHNVLTGKWLFHTSTGLKVNHMWSLIAAAVVQGNMGVSAKVSPYDPQDQQGKWGAHVCCIYNSDFTKVEEVLSLENKIRVLGIKCHLHYKPDVFSYLGIYRNNKWGLRPSIHESVFDLGTGCSKVIST